jgi:glutaminyl-tRNA synthetase
LRYACLITCKEVVKDANGEILELRCEWDPDSRGGMPKDGRKVKGTLHWVDAKRAISAEIRLYDRLFTAENPEEGSEGDADFRNQVNRNSLTKLSGSMLEPSLADAEPGQHYQFERLGYFSVDPDTATARPVFNRTIELRDTWAKVAAKT